MANHEETAVDLSTFTLGEVDPSTIGNGFIPRAADGVDFGPFNELDPGTLGKLVGEVGKNKVLRNNQSVEGMGTAVMADLVDDSGIAKPLSRSLWTPDQPVPPSAQAAVVFGAVANHQDRSTNELLRMAETGETEIGTVHVVTGNQVMDSGTEVTNPNVIEFYNEYGRYPTQNEYAERFVTPKLAEKYEVLHEQHQTDNGQQIADSFAAQNQELWTPDGKVLVVRVPISAVQLAIQIRRAARHQNPEFDADPTNPQLYMQSDTLPVPVARSAEQVARATEFQAPQPALRQAILTARYLIKEAAGSR